MTGFLQVAVFNGYMYVLQNNLKIIQNDVSTVQAEHESTSHQFDKTDATTNSKILEKNHSDIFNVDIMLITIILYTHD